MQIVVRRILILQASGNKFDSVGKILFHEGNGYPLTYLLYWLRVDVGLDQAWERSSRYDHSNSCIHFAILHEFTTIKTITLVHYKIWGGL